MFGPRIGLSAAVKGTFKLLVETFPTSPSFAGWAVGAGRSSIQAVRGVEIVVVSARIAVLWRSGRHTVVVSNTGLPIVIKLEVVCGCRLVFSLDQSRRLLSQWWRHGEGVRRGDSVVVVVVVVVGGVFVAMIDRRSRLLDGDQTRDSKKGRLLSSFARYAVRRRAPS